LRSRVPNSGISSSSWRSWWLPASLSRDNFRSMSVACLPNRPCIMRRCYVQRLLCFQVADRASNLDYRCIAGQISFIIFSRICFNLRILHGQVYHRREVCINSVVRPMATIFVLQLYHIRGQFQYRLQMIRRQIRLSRQAYDFPPAVEDLKLYDSWLKSSTVHRVNRGPNISDTQW
jgi:hypothetical protein